MNAERLLKLADHLDTVPRKEFDMGTWKCGTTACALGHACDVPSFKRAGLKMGTNCVGQGIPAFEGSIGCNAAAKLFDIEYLNALDLFGFDTSDVTPKQVARRIRKFVKDNSK